MPGRIAWVLVVAAAAGCGIDSGGTLAGDSAIGTEMDGSSPGLDAGTNETGPRLEAGPDRDAGPPPIDAGPPPVDTGPPPPLCAPIGSRCSRDGTARIDCTDLGESIVPCSRGCTGTDCRAPAECPFVPETVSVPSTTPHDTCGAGDDHRFVDDGVSCRSGYPADGEDVVVKFELDRPTRVRLELVDVDSGRSVDTMLYVRQGGCDDSGRQIACNDDGGSGRTAAIERDFEAGEYFVVLDAFDDSGEWDRCGLVELRITTPP